MPDEQILCSIWLELHVVVLVPQCLLVRFSNKRMVEHKKARLGNSRTAKETIGVNRMLLLSRSSAPLNSTVASVGVLCHPNSAGCERK